MAYSSMIDPKPKKKGSVTLHFQHGRSKKSFQKADVRTGDPNYGNESATKSTPEHVIKAQKAGADLAEHNGKPYRAGYSTIHKEPDTHSVKIEHSNHIPAPKKSAYETMQTRQGTAEIRQKSAPGPKRRLPRVSWLAGRNKRTESGY